MELLDYLDYLITKSRDTTPLIDYSFISKEVFSFFKSEIAGKLEESPVIYRHPRQVQCCFQTGRSKNPRQVIQLGLFYCTHYTASSNLISGADSAPVLLSECQKCPNYVFFKLFFFLKLFMKTTIKNLLNITRIN